MAISAKSSTAGVTATGHRIALFLDRLAYCTVGLSSKMHCLPAHKGRQRTLLGGPILIITAISALLGISLVAILFQKELSLTFLFLFTSMPRFEVLDMAANTDATSSLYAMYANFRTVSFFVMSVAMVMAGLSFGLESVNLVPPKLGAKILGNGMLYLILIMVFPYFWDMTADVVEWTSLWILNPSDPAMAHDTVAALLSYMSPGTYPRVDYVDLFGGSSVELVGATFTAIVDGITGSGTDADVLEGIGEGYQRKITALLTEALLYVFKSIALLTMSLTAFLLGTVRFVLTGLLAVAVPLILALSLIPQFNRMTSLMRDTLVALMIVPVFSALAISAGVAVLADLESSDFGRIDAVVDQAGDGADSAPPAIQELTIGVRQFFMSLAVLVLAIYFPVMLAPMMTSVMSSVQQHISTAGVAGSVIVSGTQATLAQSIPAFRWGAEKAYLKGRDLSDIARYGWGAPLRGKPYYKTRSSGKKFRTKLAHSAARASSMGLTDKLRLRQIRSLVSKKRQTQDDIVKKGDPHKSDDG